MSAKRSLCCFSRGGEYLATCSFEGELKIWDSASGLLHQTFTSSHLRGDVTCLSWSRNSRKRRSSNSSEALHLIAVSVGSKVIVWNLAKGEEEEFLTSEHSDEVTSIDWDLGNSKLYTGSKDRHVVEWKVASGKSTRKWKADKMGVWCVCCHGDGTILLTGGCGIKLWNLADYTLIKKVTGHASSVRQLCFVGGDMFLSCATGDRIINLWKCSDSSAASVATLSCDDEVLSLDGLVADDDDVRVAALSQEGNLLLYQFTSTTLVQSPVTTTTTLSFVSQPVKSPVPSPLPLLAVAFPSHSPHKLTVAHTSPIRPSMECIDFYHSDEHVCLVRNSDPTSLLIANSSHSHQAPASQASEVTILGPGNMTIQQAHSNDLRPLSDRLPPLVKRSKGVAPPPSADSMTQLLVQSISSDDSKLLEEVLRVSKEKIVSATVKKLPVHIVLPLMRKLIDLLQASPSRGLELSLWIKTLLSAHAAYLMTVPQLSVYLSGLYQLLEARVTTFSRLCHLQGKLDLILAQSADDGTSAAEVALTTPLLTVTLGEDSAEATQSDGNEDLWSTESASDDNDSMETDHDSYSDVT